MDPYILPIHVEVANLSLTEHSEVKCSLDKLVIDAYTFKGDLCCKQRFEARDTLVWRKDQWQHPMTAHTKNIKISGIVLPFSLYQRWFEEINLPQTVYIKKNKLSEKVIPSIQALQEIAKYEKHANSK